MKEISELGKYGIDENEVKNCVRSYANREITVTVTGEFSSGKSCFINAVVGRRALLPEGETECTPVYADLSAGERDSLLVIRCDGGNELYELTEENLERFARYRKGLDNEITALNITLGSFPMNSKLHILDCPGTNTVISEHEQITRRVLRRSDAVIYVFNKVITESDRRSIENIFKYNKDIIFVMTHIDEADGSAYLPGESIGKYMTEARNSLLDFMGIDADGLVLFPIGSVRAFSDRTYLDPIIDYLNSIAESCGEKILRDKARHKILGIIDNAVSKKEAEANVLRSAHMMDSDKLESQIKQAEKKLEILNGEIGRVKESISERADAAYDKACGKIKSASDQCARRLSDKIKSSSFDVGNTDAAERMIREACEKYDTEIAKILNNIVCGMVNDEYKNASEKIRESAKGIELPVFGDFELKCPIFPAESPDVYESCASLLRKIEECDSELGALEELKNLDEREYNRRCAAVEQRRAECALAVQNRKELGPYCPQFDVVKNEGGGDTGRKIGRVIGEIADIALLFIPVGGGAEAAKKAVQTGAKSAVSAVQVADKAKDAAKVAQYVAGAASKVSKKGSALEKISKILDMASFGHWAEKLGGAIGNAIKPPSEITVENAQVREAYFQNLDSMNNEISVLQREIRNEEEALADNTSIMENAKKRAALNAKKNRLEQQCEEYNRLQQLHAEQEKQIRIVEDYGEQIAELFQRQTEENSEYAREIIFSAAKLAADAVENDFSDRLSHINGEIERLKSGKDDIMSSLEETEKLLGDFDEIRESVDVWLSE